MLASRDARGLRLRWAALERVGALQVSYSAPKRDPGTWEEQSIGLWVLTCRAPWGVETVSAAFLDDCVRYMGARFETHRELTVVDN